MQKEVVVSYVLGRSHRARSPLRRQLGQLLNPESRSWDLEDGCIWEQNLLENILSQKYHQGDKRGRRKGIEVH